MKQGTGTLTLSGSNTYNGPIVVNAGTLKLNVAGAKPTIGTGVTATVAAGATLELAGSTSNLGTARGNRVHVVNDSLGAATQPDGLVISGTNQVVGGIDGRGSTQVGAGSGLTADHIIQAVLVIDGTAGNPALVTIDASSASGTPLTQTQSLGESLESNGRFAFGSDSNSLTGPALDQADSPALVAQATVPEPASIVLLVLAGMAVLAHGATRTLPRGGKKTRPRGGSIPLNSGCSNRRAGIKM